jgi:transcription-repair coupling factor (superfamily II helicase)
VPRSTGWAARPGRSAGPLKERIREIAGELLLVAAARARCARPGAGAGPASYNQFVDRFPWAETEDQEAPSRTCWPTLGEGKPMDRLVCGDVGFGKTEVALRAAFVAAMAGQQVAVVAPTTLLARQHYKALPSASPASR